jgi:hypothetical protein
LLTIRQKKSGVPADARRTAAARSDATADPRRGRACAAQRGVHRPGLVGDGFAHTQDAPPRFVRLVRTMPVTATRKTARSELRAQRWHTEDPVLWRPYGPGAAVHGSRPVHRRLTSKDRERLRTLFAGHGRADLVRSAAADPAAPQSGRRWA